MKHIIKNYIAEYEKEHGEIQLPEKTTRAEAWEAQKELMKNKDKSPIQKMKESAINGIKYGNAEK